MKFSKLKLLLSIIFLFVAVSTAQSQCPPYRSLGFGHSISAAGDLNMDGITDLLLGNYTSYGPGFRAGRALVISVQDGDTLFQFSGEAAGDQFGWSVSATGDIDNDGYNDFIIGAPLNGVAGVDAGRVYVFSGQTGDTLHIFGGVGPFFHFGSSVSSAGDVDNDGFDDIIVGVPRYPAAGYQSGRAYVFSGQTGDTLYVFNGEASNHKFGQNIISAGDMDNDGHDDIVISALWGDSSNIETGRVYVFSGSTGDTLFTLSGEADYDAFGSGLATLGDWDNDGHDDLIVGAPGFNGTGRVYVYSGQTGDTIRTLSGGMAGYFGWSLSLAGDVDNDGFDDILVESYSDDKPGQVYVLSINTGDTLRVFLVAGSYDHHGDPVFEGHRGAITYAGDVDGDNLDDIVIATVAELKVFVYTGPNCIGIRGDVNGDGIDANVLDLTFTIDRMFRGGYPPPCWLESDVNSDGRGSNVLDLTFLVDRIFRGGPAPGPCP